MNWIQPDDLWTTIGLIIAAAITLWASLRTRRGVAYLLRPIPGLQAIDEAIGRATEMGRPVLYTPGYGGDIQRPTTIASMSILASVAEKSRRI